MNVEACRPGQQIRIVQTVHRREGDWQQDVSGTVVSVRAEKTGSWYAHARNGQYWLYRIRLRKADGELTTLTIDQRTRIEPLGSAPAALS